MITLLICIIAFKEFSRYMKLTQKPKVIGVVRLLISINFREF